MHIELTMIDEEGSHIGVFHMHDSWVFCGRFPGDHPEVGAHVSSANPGNSTDEMSSGTVRETPAEIRAKIEATRREERIRENAARYCMIPGEGNRTFTDNIKLAASLEESLDAFFAAERAGADAGEVAP